VAGPDAAAGRPGGLLFADVLPRVPQVGDRPALGGHPGVQVLGTLEAHGDDPAIAIDVPFFARNRRSPYSVGQRQRRFLSAAPRLAAGIEASLAALGGVDAVQPDPLAMNLDRVAVNHAGDARDRVTRSGIGAVATAEEIGEGRECLAVPRQMRCRQGSDQGDQQEGRARASRRQDETASPSSSGRLCRRECVISAAKMKDVVPVSIHGPSE